MQRAKLESYRRVALLMLVLWVLAALQPMPRRQGPRGAMRRSNLQADFFVEPKRGDGVIMLLLSAKVERDLESGELVERAAAGTGGCFDPDGCAIRTRS